MSSIVREGSLGSVLLKARIITEQDIETAIQEQKHSNIRFGEALLALRIVSQEDINWALSSQLDIPYLKLNPAMIDPDAIKLVPGHICRKFQMIPLIKAGDELSIAMSDPLDKEALEQAEEASGCSINRSVASSVEISELLDQFYGKQQAVPLGFNANLSTASQMEQADVGLSDLSEDEIRLVTGFRKLANDDVRMFILSCLDKGC